MFSYGTVDRLTEVHALDPLLSASNGPPGPVHRGPTVWVRMARDFKLSHACGMCARFVVVPDVATCWFFMRSAQHVTGIGLTRAELLRPSDH